MADTLTITYTTTLGTLTQTKTLTTADTAKLIAAFKATATTVSNPNPTNADAFNAMLSMWYSQTISFVQSYQLNQQVIAPIAVT